MTLDNFSIPFEIDCKKDYILSLNLYLNTYKESCLSHLKLNGFDNDLCFFIENKLEKIIIEIIDILNSHKKTHIENTSLIFNKLMTSVSNEIELLKSLELNVLEKTFFRFRIDAGIIDDRLIETNFPLFHIPFNKRYLVSNSRYNLNGFPCLYVSDSIELAFKETLYYHSKNTSIDNFEVINTNVACYKNLQNIKVIDFSLVDLCLLEKKVDHAIYLSYLVLYPLLISLHTKINYESCKTKNIHFRNEYVIPNLLLIWFINKRYNDNDLNRKNDYYIRYSSVRVNNLDSFNYIFHPTDFEKSIYCNMLSQIFLHEHSLNLYSEQFEDYTKKTIDISDNLSIIDFTKFIEDKINNASI